MQLSKISSNDRREETLDRMGVDCDCYLCYYETKNEGHDWDEMLEGSNLLPHRIAVNSMFASSNQHRDLFRLIEEIKRIMVSKKNNLQGVIQMFSLLSRMTFPAGVQFILSTMVIPALVLGPSPSSTWQTGSSGLGSSYTAAL